MLLLESKEYERQSKGWLDAETFIQLRHTFNVKTKLLTRIRAKGMAASAQKPINFTGISSSEILWFIPQTDNNWQLVIHVHTMVGTIKHNILEIGGWRWLWDLTLAIEPVGNVLYMIGKRIQIDI